MTRLRGNTVIVQELAEIRINASVMNYQDAREVPWKVIEHSYSKNESRDKYLQKYMHAFYGFIIPY